MGSSGDQFTRLKNPVLMLDDATVHSAASSANVEKNIPVTIYGGRSDVLHCYVRRVTIFEDPMDNAEARFKQLLPYYRDMIFEATGTNIEATYMDEFRWGGGGWSLMQPYAMYGYAQAIFQSKAPAGTIVPQLLYSFPTDNQAQLAVGGPGHIGGGAATQMGGEAAPAAAQIDGAAAQNDGGVAAQIDGDGAQIDNYGGEAH